MSIEKNIISAFPKVLEEPTISDQFIVENQNIMELKNDIDHLKIVPSYMLWCLRNKDTGLVDMNTISALAEYGRSKIKDNNYFNFKWRCNESQKHVVIEFLNWCKKELFTVQEEQIERAIRQWEK